MAGLALNVETSRLWHREHFINAVTSSDLSSTQRFVALCYAYHARDRAYAWVTEERLIEWTGFKKTAVINARNVLKSAGWLELKRAGTQHLADVYWLRILPAMETSEATVDEQGSGTRAPDDGTASSQGAARQTPAESRRPLAGLRGSDSGARGLVDGPNLTAPHPHRGGEVVEPSARKIPPRMFDDAVEVLIVGHDVDRDEASACVEHVAATKPEVKNLAAYVGTFDRETVLRYARRLHGVDTGGVRSSHLPHPSRPRAVSQIKGRGPDLCAHGVGNGMRVLGAGSDSSRACGSCETEYPAEAVESADSDAHRAQLVG